MVDFDKRLRGTTGAGLREGRKDFDKGLQGTVGAGLREGIKEAASLGKGVATPTVTNLGFICGDNVDEGTESVVFNYFLFLETAS